MTSKVVAMAGFSVGEITALIASEAISLEQGIIRIVFGSNECYYLTLNNSY